MLSLPLSYVSSKGIVPLAVSTALLTIGMFGWRPVTESLREHIGLAVSTAAFVIAILIAGVISGTFIANLTKIAGIMGSLIIVYSLSIAGRETDREALRQKALCIACAALITAAGVSARSFLFTAIEFDQFANGNTYSNLLAVVCLPAVILVSKFLSPIVGVVVAIVIAWQIWTIGTMASAVSIILGILIFLIAHRSPRAVLWIFGLFSVTFIGIILFNCGSGETVFLTMINNQLFPYTLNDVSITHRLYIYDFTNRAICSAPWFGIGIESILTFPGHDSYLPDIKRYLLPRHPHNGWMHIWVAGGVFSLLSVMSLLLLAVRGAVEWKGDPLMRAALLGGLTAWFFIQQVSFSVWSAWWIASIAVLISVSIYNPVRRDNDS